MKKVIETLLLLGASLLLAGCGFVKSSSYPMLDEVIKAMEVSIPADSALEEMVEDVIEEATGFDLDLSPGSPEVK